MKKKASPQFSMAWLLFYLSPGKKQVVSKANCTTRESNLAEVMPRVLKNVPEDDGELMYEMNSTKHKVCILNKMPITYVILIESDVAVLTAMACLHRMSEKFEDKYSVQDFNSQPGYYVDFDGTIRDEGVHFTQNAYENEKARQVGNQIDQVKGVLIQNIEAIIDRREKIEIIVDKTEALKATSLQFRQGTVNLKRSIQCKNIKMYLAITGAVLVGIFILVLVICKPNFDNCS